MMKRIITVNGTAKCYANLSNESWSGSIECKSFPVEISAKPERYLASGKKVIIPVSVVAIGGYDLPKVKATINRDDLAEIIEIGDVDNKGNVSVKLQTKKAGACELNLSISGAAVTVPIIIARDSDTNLKDALTAKPVKVNIEFGFIQIMLSTLLVLASFAIVSNIAMVVIRKRKAIASGKIGADK